MTKGIDSTMGTKNTIEIFTDGACAGNPGPGGWGAILRWQGVEKLLSGYCENTTNNRMELTATIHALESLKRPMHVVLSTDSTYVKNGITQWIHAWKVKGWKNVKNPDLWKRLDSACQPHTIDWIWVKGHSGHVENERCDIMAKEAMRSLQKEYL